MCQASVFLESIVKLGNFWKVAFSKVQGKKKKKRHFRALALLGKCCERQPGTCMETSRKSWKVIWNF